MLYSCIWPFSTAGEAAMKAPGGGQRAGSWLVVFRCRRVEGDPGSKCDADMQQYSICPVKDAVGPVIAT